MPKYVGQIRPWACFPIAVYNACLWAGHKPPDLDDMVKVARCEHGATICYDPVLGMTPLKWRRRSTRDVFEGDAGIISIYHPTHNLHAVFCFWEDDQLRLVNALLSENVVDTVPFELPPWDHQCKVFQVEP